MSWNKFFNKLVWLLDWLASQLSCFFIELWWIDTTYKFTDFLLIDRWLYKEATVHSTRADDKDSEKLLVDAIMTDAAYAKFHSLFGKKVKSWRFLTWTFVRVISVLSALLCLFRRLLNYTVKHQIASNFPAFLGLTNVAYHVPTDKRVLRYVHWRTNLLSACQNTSVVTPQPCSEYFKRRY